MAVFNPMTSVGGYNPIASTQQNNKPSLSVAQASPGIYASAMQTGLNDIEKKQIEDWSLIANKHKELMKMGNAEAGAAYNRLDNNVKGLLDAYYGVDYSRRAEGATSALSNKIVGGAGNDGVSALDLAKSPMRGVFALGEGYGRVVNSYGKAGLLSSTGQEVKLDTAFNGEAIFNPEYTKPLIDKYGGQRGIT